MVGSIGIDQVSNEVLKVEDRGGFYITNKRIGFISQKKQFEIPINKVLSFKLSHNSLFLFKKGKESLYILDLEEYDLPMEILSFIFITLSINFLR